MSDLIVMKGVRFTEKRLRQWLKSDGKVWADIKRDEFRCFAEILGTTPSAGGYGLFFTASGKGQHANIPNAVHDLFVDIATEYGIGAIDCGLMVSDSFDLTRRTLKTNRVYDLTGSTHHTILDKVTKAERESGAEDVTVHSGPLRLRVYLYDLPEHPGTFEERRRILRLLAAQNPEWLAVPEGEWVNSVEQARDCIEESIGAGHEGMMFKRANYEWLPTRTTDWMKGKLKDERDGEIVGFIPGKVGTEFEGLIGSVSIRFVDGSTADASGMSLPVRRDMTENPDRYIGKIAAMTFMQRDTQGGYRHPVYQKLHEDKTEIEQCD